MEYPEIKEQMERQGYQMTDEEFSEHLAYARRKAEVVGKQEDYIPLLLPDVIKEHYMRKAINSFTMGLMELDRAIENHIKEVKENGKHTAATATV